MPGVITAAKRSALIPNAISPLLAAKDMIITFLAIFALGTISASAIPTKPALILPNSTAAISGFDTSIHCNSEPFGQKVIGDDCRAAVARFPKDEPGDVYVNPQSHRYIYPEFTRAPGLSRHRLPVTVEAGSCIVEVRLAPGVVEDNSSWRIIALRARNVIDQCVGSKFWVGGKNGGMTVTGENKGIEVIVYSAPVKSMKEVLGMGNGTAATS